MDVATLIIVSCVLFAQIWLMWRWIKEYRRNEVDTFEPPFVKPRGKHKVPVVRDEVAAWRREQEEKFAWESQLKQKENRR